MLEMSNDEITLANIRNNVLTIAKSVKFTGWYDEQQIINRIRVCLIDYFPIKNSLDLWLIYLHQAAKNDHTKLIDYIGQTICCLSACIYLIDSPMNGFKTEEQTFIYASFKLSITHLLDCAHFFRGGSLLGSSLILLELPSVAIDRKRYRIINSYIETRKILQENCQSDHRDRKKLKNLLAAEIISISNYYSIVNLLNKQVSENQNKLFEIDQKLVTEAFIVGEKLVNFA